MYYPKYAMFFDNHTLRSCPDVGHDFDAERFADELKKNGVDLIGFHAKCNQGFCYYNTKIGIRHPSLPKGMDLFGEVVKACGKRNIRVSAYLNCGLSNEDAIQHPDWNRIGMNGEILHPEVYDLGWVSPYIRTMCPNSPWRNYLLSLIKEVRDQYPVAGFLFDSFNVFPCVCPHCVAGMKKLGMDPQNEADVMKFAQMSVLRLAEDISSVLEPKKNGLLVYFLGISAQDNARIGSYLECECLPTNPCWGYDYLPIMARYLRKLADDGRPVLNMTGRFYDWGDFGSLRTVAAVKYDLFFGLANGMRPNIGDHIYPSGRINRGMFQRVQKIYADVRAYEKWHREAVPVTETGVILPSMTGTEKTPALTGAVRLFSELKLQFDLLDAECDWSPYRLLVLPDDTVLNERMKEKLAEAITRGAKVFMTGSAGQDKNGSFLLEKEFGITLKGECGYSPTYFTMRPEYAKGIPDMPLFIGKNGWIIEPETGTETAGYVVEPYVNKVWDGVSANFYAPPKARTQIPFAVIREERLAYCPFRVFSTYDQSASVDLKHVVSNLLQKILPEPLIRVDGNTLPSFARVFITEKAESRMVHFLNYVPELRGKMLIVEEEIEAHNVAVEVRLDGRNVKAVIIQPAEEKLPFETHNGYVSFTVPVVKGYCLVELKAKE